MVDSVIAIGIVCFFIYGLICAFMDGLIALFRSLALLRREHDKISIVVLSICAVWGVAMTVFVLTWCFMLAIKLWP